MNTTPEVSARSSWTRALGRSGLARWLVPALAVVAAGAVTATVVTRKGGGVREVTLPAGTRVAAALAQTLSTEKSRVGDRVDLETAEPLPITKGVTLPAGIVVHAEVIVSKGGGRISGAPELALRFSSMNVNGKDYPIEAEPFRVRGKSDARESAAEIGGGAVAGGIVGAIAGNTLKGAAVGAVLGTGVAVATKGNQIVLPAGQKVRVRLSQPVKVSYKPAPPRKT